MMRMSLNSVQNTEAPVEGQELAGEDGAGTDAQATQTASDEQAAQTETAEEAAPEEAEIIPIGSVEYERTLGNVSLESQYNRAVTNNRYDSKKKEYKVIFQTEYKNDGVFDGYVRLKVADVHLENSRTQITTDVLSRYDAKNDVLEVGILDEEGKLFKEGTDFTVTDDGYIYLNEKLPKGYSVYAVYNTWFTTQELYKTGYSGTSLKASTVGEIVQTSNFNPDYNSADPWHGIEIEKQTKANAAPVGGFEVSPAEEGENYTDLTAHTDDNMNAYVAPGDTLQFKAVDFTGDLRKSAAVVPGVSLEVRLQNAQGDELEKKVLKTNEFGSIAGSSPIRKAITSMFSMTSRWMRS